MKNVAAPLIAVLLLGSSTGLYAQTAYGNHLIVSAFERQLNPTKAIAPTNGVEVTRSGLGSRLIAEVNWNGESFDSTVYTYNGGRGGDYEDNTTALPIQYDIATTYTAENVKGPWQLSSRKLQEFNTLDQVVSVTGQDWNGMSWVNTDRTLYTYNNAGLNETMISQVFQIGTGSWTPVYRITFTYNGQDQVVQSRYDSWNTLNTMYDPTSQNIYMYEPRSMSYVIQLFNGANGKYENHHRYVYYFNGDRVQTGESHQVYKADAWENSDSTVIVASRRSNAAENIFYSWNNGEWNRYGHYLLTYNDAGKQIASQDEHVDQLGNEYKAQSRDALTYNNYNQRLTMHSYLLPTNKPDAHARYYYETYKPGVGGIEEKLAASLTLYPTPAEKVVNVNMTFPEPQKISCAIYDLNGKALQVWESEAGTTYSTQVSVSELPSGTYWFKVKSNGAEQMSKTFTVRH